jgi:hypothetical protein
MDSYGGFEHIWRLQSAPAPMEPPNWPITDGRDLAEQRGQTYEILGTRATTGCIHTDDIISSDIQPRSGEIDRCEFCLASISTNKGMPGTNLVSPDSPQPPLSSDTIIVAGYQRIPPKDGSAAPDLAIQGV